jgi:hypothetical protein
MAVFDEAKLVVAVAPTQYWPYTAAALLISAEFPVHQVFTHDVMKLDADAARSARQTHPFKLGHPRA